MKIQIDTENKTIKLQEEVNTEVLFRFLKATFPKEWGNFKICTEVIVNWSNSIYVPTYPLDHFRPWYNYFPQPYISVAGDSTTGITNWVDKSESKPYTLEASDNHHSKSYYSSEPKLAPGIYNLEFQA